MVGLWGSAVQSSGPNANERQGEGRACIATSALDARVHLRRRPRWSSSRWWLLGGCPRDRRSRPGAAAKSHAQRARSPSSRRRATPHRGSARRQSSWSGAWARRTPCGACPRPMRRPSSERTCRSGRRAWLASPDATKIALLLAGVGARSTSSHPAREASSVVVRVAGRQTARRDGLAVVEKPLDPEIEQLSRRQPGHPVELFDALRRERQRC